MLTAVTADVMTKADDPGMNLDSLRAPINLKFEALWTAVTS